MRFSCKLSHVVQFGLFLLFCSPNATALLLPPAPISAISSNTVSSSLDFPASLNATFPPFLPYRFDVWGTGIVLHIGFGLRRSIPLENIRNLLDVAINWIKEQIHEHQSLHDFYPVHDGEQRFEKSIGEGVKLEVWNVKDQTFFTWDILENVVAGIRFVMVNENRGCQCFWKIKYEGSLLGKGQVVRERRGVVERRDWVVARDK